MELKMKSPAMMTLIAMGITVAYIYSLYSFIANKLNPHEHVMDFFWELATLIVIMLLGHWVRNERRIQCQQCLEEVSRITAGRGESDQEDGSTQKVKLQEIKSGDMLLVRAGDKMPTDGQIIKGTTIVDESAVTGESKGVQKNVGDTVIGGSVNGDGTIRVKVTGTGEDGYLAKVVTMVQQAQQEKSKLESISDKVAKWLFYIALVAGLLTFTVWLFVADFHKHWIEWLPFLSSLVRML